MKKICGVCGREQWKTNFHVNNAKDDGLQSYCKDCKSDYMKDYGLCNRKKLSEQVRIRVDRLYHSDPNFRIKSLLKGFVNGSLKNNKESSRFKELVGCSVKDLKDYLISLGMDFGEWGRSGIHIDHIIGWQSFDLEDEVEQKKYYNWTNLQPLFYLENIRKSNKAA